MESTAPFTVQNPALFRDIFLTHFPACSGTFHEYFSPGRINIIGEHIDYNGGFVLPFAIPYGISAGVCYVENGTTIEIRSTRFSSSNADTIVFERDADGYFSTHKSKYIGQSRWAVYVAGVIELLQRKYNIRLPGAKILYDTNLPMESGLSSSASIEVITAYMFAHCTGNKLYEDKPLLAQFCQEVEQTYVGVNCGIMDQMAVALGYEKTAILIDCSVNRFWHFNLNPDGYQFVILNSNVNRTLTQTPYNKRYAECQEALRLIQKQSPIAYLSDANIRQIYTAINDPVLSRRAKHVVYENQRTIAAVEAIQQKNWPALGKLLNDSHHSLRYNYEVTGFELDTLVEAAQTQPECVGARMTGAGFGGCAIALVELDKIPAFAHKVKAIYDNKTQLHVDVLPVTPFYGTSYVAPF